MQIAIGAKCWDGDRRKVLQQAAKPAAPIVVYENKSSKWKFDPKLKALVSFAVPIALLAGGLPPIGLGRALASAITPGAVAAAPEVDSIPAMGGVSAGIHAKILHAFDPLVNLIQDLSYPIAAVMIAGGCLFIMVGNRERGMQMLQNAAIGYILVQMAPLLLNLLVGIGGSV